MIKDQLIFSANNPITSNHTVYGQSLLPGLAYIDLLFQCFRKHGYRFNELEMKNLTIHHPLIVSNEGKVIVSVLAKENGPGSWKVGIEGRKLYATAEMTQTEGYTSSDTLDVVSQKERAEETYPIADIYGRYQARDMVHKGFIRAEGTIYKLEDGLLFGASLGKEAAPTADQFMFHPTLMDGSAVAMMRLFESVVKEEENLFLPLYYESFRAAALINKNCYAFLPVSSIKRKNDIISFSIYFFDERGKKIGELINLTTKRVREGLGDSVIKAPQVSQKNGAMKKERGAEAFLRQLVGSQLNIDQSGIGMEMEYYKMGFDSVSLLQLVAIIGNEIGEELPPTLLFEYSNISALADHLTNTYAEKFA